ncbi:5-hydroxytryptamine receptor 3A-like [Tachysurus fulvidraco]|uniref:5-hydroxytryptamine receptor 3A-like n=1 Tax=Tachysurus fulvidraco TaxID=1234273 RepID=UPI001FEFA959|nr:5-hydroxytryptamine receptor 3A-like [Tachysurus fulvidraco]
MAQQRGSTLFRRWLFVLLIKSHVPSVGCQKTSDVPSVNCTNNNTQSLYAEINTALWSNKMRPVTHPSEVLTVKLGLSVAGILGVDEKKQVTTAFIIITMDWMVPFLSWNKAECGFENISYPASELWLPSIQIAEHMDEEINIDIPYLQLNYTGGVHLVQLKRVVASCQMDIYKFPFDAQNCSLTFHSYLHEENELKLMSKSATFIFDSSVHSDSGWRFVNITDLVSATTFTSKRAFSAVKYGIFLKREASLYILNLLVPSCFLSLLDLFSFFLSPQNVDRSAFKMTLILGYTVFLLITNDLLPDSSSHTALINVFFSLSLALMVASLLEAMLIVNLSNTSKHYPKVPRWLRVLVLDFLAHLLFMSPKLPAAPVTVTFNPHAKVRQDMSGEATTPAEAEEREKIEGAAMVDELKKVARDVQAIRLRLEEHLSPKENEWKLIADVIDRLLFRIYLLFVIVTYITILAMWLKH